MKAVGVADPSVEADEPAGEPAPTEAWRQRLTAASRRLHQRIGTFPSWARTAATVLTLTLGVSVPLFVALAVLREPRWFTFVDLAQIELRVRDVASTNPPLLGLGGRIRGLGVQGSHPGPLGFYALWPVYQLFGADGWALQVSGVAVNIAAVGLAVWVGHRRGGWTFAVAVAAMYALLMRGFGGVVLAEPWNPHIPVLWWPVFLLAVWAVVCDDLPMLPLAVVAGSICAQTHLPYVGLIGGLGAATAALVAVTWWRRRDDPVSRRRSLRWIGLAGGLLVLLWLPPLIEQLTNRPGNAEVIVDDLRHPWDDRVAFGTATELWLSHFDVEELLSTRRLIFDNQRGGVVVLALWAGAVVLAWRRRQANLLRLHSVLGVAAGLGLVSMSRLFGPMWNYLMFWAWGTTAVVVMASVWTYLAAPVEDGAGRSTVTPLRWLRLGVGLLGLAALWLTALFSVSAADTEMPAPEVSDAVRLLAADTDRALAEDPVGCGDDCRYLVLAGGEYMGGLGDGLRMALERQGYDARFPIHEELAVRSRRVIDPSDADAVIEVPVGVAAIERLRAEGGARELAYAQPHTVEEQRRYHQLRDELLRTLEAEGLTDLATEVGEQALIRWEGELLEQAPAAAEPLARELQTFMAPSAVFLLDIP
jgi:hypothetical protein